MATEHLVANADSLSRAVFGSLIAHSKGPRRFGGESAGGPVEVTEATSAHKAIGLYLRRLQPGS